MSDVPSSAESSTGTLEQRFLAALGNPSSPTSELFDLINALHASAPSEKVNQYALVLEDSLAKAGELEGLVSLFEMRLDWAAQAGDTKRVAIPHMAEALSAAARKDRLNVAFVESISLGKPGVSDREALRRLRVLLQCKPGAHCLDKTWGFGTVVRLDAFYRRMTLDFDRKKGHALAFGYAAESIRMLGPDHILSRFHADREGFFKRFKEEPAEVVKDALRSFGPMSVTHMEDEFTSNGLLPKAEGYLPASAKGKNTPADVWKRFWTQARAVLKNDPEVSLPPTTKKNDPITLLLKAVSFGDSTWFSDFEKRTDVAEILSAAADVYAAKLLPTLSEEERASAKAILANRLEFAYVAARTRTKVVAPAVQTRQDTAVSNEFRYKRWLEGVRQGATDMVRATLLARELELEAFSVDEFICEMSNPSFLSTACLKLAQRDLTAFCGLIPVQENEEAALPFVNALQELPFAVVDVLLPGLLRGTASVQTRALLTESFGKGTVSYPLLLWMARHQGDEDVRTIVPPSTIATTCLIALDRQTSGEELKLFHQIAHCFEDSEWLQALMNRMDDDARQALLNRIRANDSAWEPRVKRLLVRDLLAHYPELAAQHQAAEVEAPAEVVRLTSWRSYKAYTEKLRILVEEEIPKNAHDIDVARGYGDLRENFEYQTAKDTQRMLLQRQADLSEQIALVSGTDFANVPTDLVAMGTEVSLRFADGSAKTYTILGEWDNEESLGILPSLSRIAETLLGKAVGAAVELPALDVGGEPQSATIEAIRPLSQAVQEWIRG